MNPALNALPLYNHLWNKTDGWPPLRDRFFKRMQEGKRTRRFASQVCEGQVIIITMPAGCVRCKLGRRPADLRFGDGGRATTRVWRRVAPTAGQRASPVPGRGVALRDAEA